MSENSRAELTRRIAQEVRDGQRTIEIRTLAGTEQLNVTWKKTQAIEGNDRYSLVVKDQKKNTVGYIEYTINLTVRPPVARVENKFVEPPYRGKDIAQQLFQLVAKDLEERGILQVESKIRIGNTPALVSRQHVREILTGRRYKTTYQPSVDQTQFYEVVTLLDQFEDEQGET